MPTCGWYEHVPASWRAFRPEYDLRPGRDPRRVRRLIARGDRLRRRSRQYRSGPSHVRSKGCRHDPTVLTEISGESVLVMDWIEGIPLSNREGLEEAGADRVGLARAILQAYGVMIFQSDRFHADPHPGNLIAMEGDRLGLIDFGEVGSVEPAERSALQGMVTAVLGRDGEALAARCSPSVEAHALSTKPTSGRNLARSSTLLPRQT